MDKEFAFDAIIVIGYSMSVAVLFLIFHWKSRMPLDNAATMRKIVIVTGNISLSLLCATVFIPILSVFPLLFPLVGVFLLAVYMILQ